MASEEATVGGPDPTASSPTQPDSVTRGFLFADLRGYTEVRGAIETWDRLAALVARAEARSQT